jgi:hypothetical protein
VGRLFQNGLCFASAAYGGVVFLTWSNDPD